MQIRVLNLDRSRDRLDSFRAHNPHLPWIERVTAIDGATLDRAKLVADGWLTSDLSYTQGAVGNALSHMGLWKEAAAGNASLTILEDDAVLCGNFREEASRVLDNLDPDWDFMLWGYNFDTVLSYELMPGLSSCTALFDQTRMRQKLSSFHTMQGTTSGYRLLRSLGIPAYSISPTGAKKLLQFCRPLRPMNVDFPFLGMRSNFSIDFMLNGICQHISAYVAVPALALTANDHSQSTVQDLENLNGPWTAVTRLT